MVYQLLTAAIFFFSFGCNAGRQANAEAGKDTVLLARIDKPVTVGANPAVVSFTINENSSKLFNSNSKTMLLLLTPQTVETPDGVYEIYLTNEPPDLNSLGSTNPAFVNVMDLYAITAPGAKQIIEVDVQSHINRYLLPGKPAPVIYVTLLFNGTRLADGTKSKKAGELRLAGMSLVQVKN